MQVAFLASPPLNSHKNSTSKTLLPRTPLPHLISSLRGTFSRHPPPDPLLTHFVRQTQLSWRLLRGFCNPIPQRYSLLFCDETASSAVCTALACLCCECVSEPHQSGQGLQIIVSSVSLGRQNQPWCGTCVGTGMGHSRHREAFEGAH